MCTGRRDPDVAHAALAMAGAACAISEAAQPTGTEPSARAHSEAAERAVRSLLHRRGELLRFLERRVGSRDVAEDILQETLARGLERLDMLRDEDAVVPWLFRALRNAAIDHQRRTRGVDRALARFAEEAEKAEQPTETVPADVCACVSRVADRLKPEYLEVLRHVEVEGISVKSFAKERGISKSNAAVRVFRARDALRKGVAICCGSCADDGCMSCTCGSDFAAGRELHKQV